MTEFATKVINPLCGNVKIESINFIKSIEENV